MFPASRSVTEAHTIVHTIMIPRNGTSNIWIGSRGHPYCCGSGSSPDEIMMSIRKLGCDVHNSFCCIAMVMVQFLYDLQDPYPEIHSSQLSQAVAVAVLSKERKSAGWKRRRCERRTLSIEIQVQVPVNELILFVSKICL